MAAIGPALDLTVPVEMLGEGGESARAALSEGSASLGRGGCATAKDADDRAWARARSRGPTAPGCLGAARHIAESYGLIRGDWERIQCRVPYGAAARVGGLDLGFVPGKRAAAM